MNIKQRISLSIVIIICIIGLVVLLVAWGKGKTTSPAREYCPTSYFVGKVDKLIIGTNEENLLKNNPIEITDQTKINKLFESIEVVGDPDSAQPHYPQYQIRLLKGVDEIGQVHLWEEGKKVRIYGLKEDTKPTYAISEETIDKVLMLIKE